MSSNRKYSRSRSPGRDRSNKRKQDDNYDSHHSYSRTGHSSSRDYRDRSRDRYYDRRDRQADHFPRSTVRDRHRDSDLDVARKRRSRSRDSGHRASEARTRELPVRSQTDSDYGRLKSSSSNQIDRRRSPPDDQDHSKKRKADELSGEVLNASKPSTSRRSRFDKPSSSIPAPALSPVAHVERPSKPSAVSSPSTTPLRSSPVPVVIGNEGSDEKQRLLRERQEKLAQWKQKKAAEAAAKQAAQTIPVNQAVESSPQAALAPVAPAKIGITKFEMSSKGQKINTKVKSGSGLNFMDDDDGQRDQRQRGRDKLGVIADANFVEDSPISTAPKVQAPVEDDIDPLDAFMAENSRELSKSVGSSRIGGQILNRGASDDEEAGGQSDNDDALAAVAKKAAAKKKDLIAVDHSTQDYEPFRKDFYVEPAELANLSDAEVDAMRLELDGILIRGKDCPKPINNWGQCGLSSVTLEQVQRLGYEGPTSIQAQAIPAIMSGRDTIGVAKTGSGKTMAFLLPMFRHIKDQRPLSSMEGPIAMILTPTRELALQIHKECKPFLKALHLRAVCVYGGGSFQDQIAEIKRGSEIVVCTPGRMIDILAANQGRVTNLRRVTYTVLDEADRMFDMGFEPQVMKILNNIRPQRQTVLFSATFPKSMEALARKVLRGKPVEITVGARSVVAPEIEQKVEVRPRDPDPQKFNRVLEILGELYNTDEDARTLIFVDRQEGADNLLSQLMRKGYPCNALHGGKDQSDRASTISDFKAGIFPILVATSVAARGLDVKQLKLVINYDCPNHMEDYVHRVGRTGRAGNKGVAITFVSEDQERYAFDIAKALRLSQVQIPDALKVLADAFAAKVKSGQEKGSTSGFGGKGLVKFDTLRDQEKRTQRRLYGEDEEVVANGDASRENDAGTDDEEENDRVNPEEVRAIAESGTSASTDAPIKVERVTAQMKSAVSAKLNVGTRALNAMEAARARAEALNNRIKTGAKTLEQVASNPDAGEYRAMMEINDYPQKARWNVTNRTNIAKILEATGTSITTQGQYVKPGSSAPAGVPKLYLLVEGPTELCVTDAVKELRRLLSEGAMSDAEVAGGRYQVV